MTRQRKVILDVLQQNRTHPTADKIYEIVRRILPHISLGTVYRNLEILAERGLITKLELAGTPKRFDGDIIKHYHVRCIRCHNIGDVFISPPVTTFSGNDTENGFEVLGHRLEFFGICPECKQESKSHKKMTRKE